MRKTGRVYCFPPLKPPRRRDGDTKVPSGWTICRGSWHVPEEEATAFMLGHQVPPDAKSDAHRALYRCPKVKNVLNHQGQIELRRCRVCCRRERIDTHRQCFFDCELRFDSMTGPPVERVRDLDYFTNRFQRALAVGLARRGASVSSMGSAALLSMSRELIQIGIDAQAAIPANHQRLCAGDIAVAWSHTSIEKEIRRLASEETKEVIAGYKQVRFVNMKVDAGTVLRAHVTHALIDNPFVELIPWILDAVENDSWDTHDYESFILSRIQLVQNEGIHIAAIIHDNLAVQANAVTNVLNSLEQCPRTLDIPCLNHMLNLVFTHAAEECEPLAKLVNDTLNWQKLLRSLKIKIPAIPKTRWMYIVEVIQAMSAAPGLNAALAVEPKVVMNTLGYMAQDFPARLIELHVVLNPLFVLSKKMEQNITRLPDVIPLVRKCLLDWRAMTETYEEGDTFLEIIDALVSHLLARLHANSFPEVVTAYVLSISGKLELEQQLASTKGSGVPSLVQPRSQAIIQLMKRMDEFRDSFELFTEEVVEDTTDNEEEEEDFDFCESMRNNLQRNLESTKTSEQRRLLDFYQDVMRALTLDEKLSYDLLSDYGPVAAGSLTAHGPTIPDDEGGKSYYQCSLMEWITRPIDELVTAISRFHPDAGPRIDYLLWDHILNLSTNDDEWKAWGPLAAMAVRYQTAGVSEAEVERLFSIQRKIQRQDVTNITPEGLTARLALYGDRGISSIRRPASRVADKRDKT